jgi:hypothetical protein
LVARPLAASIVTITPQLSGQSSEHTAWVVLVSILYILGSF